MKQGWEIKKLGEVCSLIADGDWIESRHQSDDGIRLIQTGNIGNGVFKAKDDKPHYISESTFAELGCTEIFAGDCLVSRLPDPVGRACILPETNCRMITAVDCSIIRFNSDIVSKFFIYYTQCERYRRDIDNNTTGTTRKRISRKNLESITIPVPHREEQERIVAELDCLSGVIERKREQLKQLDALAQSIFYQMFGDPITNEKRWEVKKLEEVCNKITDGTHDTPERLSSGVKFITGKHIRAGIIDYDNSDYVLKEIHDEIYARCNPEYGDVLYTNIGANLGTAAINVVRYEFSMKNVALLKVKKDIINGYYLQSYLNDEEVKDDIINSFSNGGAQKFLSLKMIAKISIPLPPLVLQQEFADKIEAIEKQKELIKKSITQTEELFNSRMDYYFN